MCYCRGHRRDYDDWADSGASGWSFEEVLPYFRKSEDQENGASPYHGTGGPLSVQNLRHTNPLSGIFIEAAAQAGHERTDDFNGPRQRGFGFYDYNVEPESGVSTVIYSVNDTGIPVGIRKYIAPGVNGNVIYLAFHPYFVDKLEFRRFVRAALEDFGEVPIG
jgi:hypothetical protein